MTTVRHYVKDPFRQAMESILGCAPPIKWVPVGTLHSMQLTDEANDSLQWWVVSKLTKRRLPKLFWSTGIGIIEAVDGIVMEAISNGNITITDAEEELLFPSPPHTPYVEEEEEDSADVGD
jgi:hypothetical protein